MMAQTSISMAVTSDTRHEYGQATINSGRTAQALCLDAIGRRPGEVGPMQAQQLARKVVRLGLTVHCCV